ncbi:MAG: (Fe-S)-binding protein [Proteobacteria bacterium]|nr:(Fe-S)-binding protein [Pseudomonadota bacterium]
MKRSGVMIRQSLLQLSHFRIVHKDYALAGVSHIFVFVGFLCLLPAEIEFVLTGVFSDFSFREISKALYLFSLLTRDLCPVLVLTASFLLLFRRIVLKPAQIKNSPSAYLILLLIGLLMATTLGMNALELTVDNEEGPMGSAKWMPVARYLAGHAPGSGRYPMLHETAWWIHFFALVVFICHIPNSKHLHILTAIPANFFRHIPPPFAKLSPIQFEEEDIEAFGVCKTDQLTWKQIFDGLACTECGRCTDQCPASTTGKTLSPRELILNIKRNAIEAGKKKRGGSDASVGVNLIDDYIKRDELWQCTTCGACSHVCPVGNEHIRDIVEMRRYLAMEEADIPEIKSRAVRNLETRQNPFFGSVSGVDDWLRSLQVPPFEKNKTEYLLWIGCTSIYEESAFNITASLAEVLTKAGISFGVQERFMCCGDPAGQMGHEYLFQELARQNIDEFDRLGVRKIVSSCPHCFTRFDHGYKELGWEGEVAHHSTFLNRLVEEGKLNLKRRSKSFSYHDPCYMARHNSSFKDPRNILSKIGTISEMARNRKQTFCCGGGGGNYWAEEMGERINHRRAKEAFETRADPIATACPFCFLMLTDGMKSFTENKMVVDIAEIVNQHV